MTAAEKIMQLVIRFGHAKVDYATSDLDEPICNLRAGEAMVDALHAVTIAVQQLENRCLMAEKEAAQYRRLKALVPATFAWLENDCLTGNDENGH